MLDTRERNRISSVDDAQQNARRHAQEVAAKTNAETRAVPNREMRVLVTTEAQLWPSEGHKTVHCRNNRRIPPFRIFSTGDTGRIQNTRDVREGTESWSHMLFGWCCSQPGYLIQGFRPTISARITFK